VAERDVVFPIAILPLNVEARLRVFAVAVGDLGIALAAFLVRVYIAFGISIAFADLSSSGSTHDAFCRHRARTMR